MTDVLVIGGGVIGLSIAYELAGAGRSVRVIDSGPIAREASWAGAGILPPPPAREDVPAWEKLHAISYARHCQWSRALREETGIDNGLRICGGLHIARRAGEAAALQADVAKWREDGINVRQLNLDEVMAFEPEVRPDENAGQIRVAFHLSEEAQIRNPRHLQALALACRQRGVEITEGLAVEGFACAEDRVVAALTGRNKLAAGQFCLATGAWSQALLSNWGLDLGVYPVRGQMVLYRCAGPALHHILNEGPRYIVPRDDGRVLVGSTEEDVGFDKRTTDAEITQLRRFAESLVPVLAKMPVEQTWAGLRPHALDGFPYIGRVPHLRNAFVAAGHYRSGLTTSTGTALLMRQLMCEEELALDIREFALAR